MGKIVNITDKIDKASDSATVYFYDNAYMVEASGRDKNEDWITVKLVCKDLEEVLSRLQEIDNLPK